MRNATLNDFDRSIPDTIADRLRGAIVSGALPAGAPLNQDRIAAEYGVSHIPVREAVRRLQAEGLVIYRPRRGAFIAELSAAEYLEIMEMREALESIALRKAIQAATDDDLATMRRAAERAQKADSKAQMILTNRQFLMSLYAPCRLPRLLAAVEGLWALAYRYSLHTWKMDPSYRARDIAGHATLLDAFTARDGRRGRRALIQYLAWTRERVLDGLTRQEAVATAGPKTAVKPSQRSPRRAWRERRAP